jgi:hypothetical protein
VVVIQGQIYIAHDSNIYTYDFPSNQVSNGADDPSGATSVFSVPNGVIRGMSYGEGYLWAITSDRILYKVEWSTKTIINTYDLNSYFSNTRGVAYALNEIYVGEADPNNEIKVFQENSGDINENTFYTVFAFDASGNEGEQSDPAFVGI